MKKYKENYGRYTIFHLPDIEDCTYEKLTNFCTCKEGGCAIREEGIVWSDLEEFLKVRIYNVSDEKAKNQLIEILHWIEKRDLYSVALLVSIFWEQIEKELTQTANPDKITRYIMCLRFSIE